MLYHRIDQIIKHRCQEQINQVVNLLQTRTNSNNESLGEVIEIGTDGKLKVKLTNGTILTKVNPGSRPVGPGLKVAVVANKIIS